MEAVSALQVQLNGAKSAGIDGAHPNILKLPSLVIMEFLVPLSNRSLSASVIPEDWRIAVVISSLKRVETKSKYL